MTLALAARVASAAVLAAALSPAALAQKDPKLSRGDRGFVEKAAAHGVAEVELAKLAQEKALREEVKTFATRMAEDHGKANQELQALAAAKGLQVFDAAGKDHPKSLEKLRKQLGPDFDRAYMKQMVDDHEKDVKEFRKQAKDARDPDVKAFAAKHLPTLEDHLRQAKATRDLTLASKRSGDRETGSRK